MLPTPAESPKRAILRRSLAKETDHASNSRARKKTRARIFQSHLAVSRGLQRKDAHSNRHLKTPTGASLAALAITATKTRVPVSQCQSAQGLTLEMAFPSAPFKLELQMRMGALLDAHV